MIEIAIDGAFREKAPDLLLGCVFACVEVTGHDAALWKEIEARANALANNLAVEDISALPPVAAQRNAYKAASKNPARYRGSAEALLRRVVQAKGLYRVNTLVDLNNLLSLETFHPVGTYDRSQLEPPVVLRTGLSDEAYGGIGKRSVNLENLPLLADGRGPFGSPTSDSRRALITTDTKEILIVIFAFAGSVGLDKSLLRATALLKQYVAAAKIETKVVS